MSHASLANGFLSEPGRAAWHDEALWFVREGRDRAARTVAEWDELVALAAQIKAHALANLPEMLEQFEREAVRRGAVVHWAADAEEHNRIVCGLLEERQVQRVAKSKSMLTEECRLNPYLEARGIEVFDTDLGERIVQLREEPPSHIVLPAIHLKKEEVGELFHQHLGTPEGLARPEPLVEAARRDLRRRFLAAQAGITGVNFGIAETGGLVVCTNEGNADLGTSLPPLHIASMGIEKVIPRLQDLGVFLRLLARSATGQAITSYSSHFHGPRPDSELHVVLVDNGRSELRGRESVRDALRCIRCGACMNTCPVFRRSGGHSYAATVPGPIGSILEPSRSPRTHASLPFACSVCGSCANVCPVAIDLPQQLLDTRAELVRRGHVPKGVRRGVSWMSSALGGRRRYRVATTLLRAGFRVIPRALLERAARPWAASRALPEPAPETFRTWWRKRTQERSS